MVWIVVGSIALAVGVSTTIMAMSRLEPSTNAEISLGVIAIIVGLVIAYLQVRQTSVMDKIIRKTKNREDRRKKQYLPRIVGHTEIIRKHFDTFTAFIEKYEKEPNVDNWKIVLNHSKFAIGQIQALGKDVVEDFSHIRDLIDDPSVYYKYDDVIVYLSQFTFGYPINLNPEVQGLIELKRQIHEQIRKLDETLTKLKAEMPKDEK